MGETGYQAGPAVSPGIHDTQYNVRKNCSGAVIAGGLSSRFGSDKCRALYKGVPLFKHAANQLQDVSERVIVVNAFAGRGMYEGLQNVRDIYPEKGPLGGIHAALASSFTEWTLVLPCDMPLVTTELLSELQTERGDFDAVCYESGGILQPFPLLVNRSVTSLAALLIAKGQNSVHRFIRSCRSRLLPVNAAVHCSPDMLRSCNTPEELENMSAEID